jgi:hypothetical protein
MQHGQGLDVLGGFDSGKSPELSLISLAHQNWQLVVYLLKAKCALLATHH